MHILEALLTYQDISAEDTSYNMMTRTILGNLKQVEKNSIYDTAALCYTSTTSIGRLCHRLGYHSYGSFRSAISDALGDYTFSDYLLSDLYNGNLTPDEIKGLFAQILSQQSQAIQAVDTETLKAICDLFHEKNTIHFFSPMLDPCSFISLQLSLTLSGKQTYLHHGSFGRDEDIASQLTPQDAILMIAPNHPRWGYVSKLFREVQATGASTVLIVTTDKPCWENATIKLCLPGLNSIADSRLYSSLLDLLSCIYQKKYVQGFSDT